MCVVSAMERASVSVTPHCVERPSLVRVCWIGMMVGDGELQRFG